ncbi:MAG: hypothetical protein JWM34_4505 [Ilumatobacteraceae bacterium]|nr:hypothetical protein [Ilumatobacteraceae bacterium]
MPPPQQLPVSTALPAWILRIVWLLQPLAFVPLLSAATSSLRGSGTAVVAVLAWATWAVVLLATLVPSTVSVTVGRLAAPVVPIVAMVAALGGSVAGWKAALGLGAGLLAAIVWFSGETGMVLAQGSAYGAEQRFPLKPPVPFLVPMVMSWIVLATSAVVGSVLLANAKWIVGAVLVALAAAAGWFLGSRFHQLSRRWLVVVPAGLVVHDPLLLAENALFRVVDLAAVHLAPVDTEAADLTGGTAGVVLEIVLREMDTVVKAGTREKPAGTALHVRSVLVSPTRPGRALVAAGNRHMPVG